jgi:hypothetical protein
MNQQAKNFKKNPKAAVIKDNTSAQTEKTCQACAILLMASQLPYSYRSKTLQPQNEEWFHVPGYINFHKQPSVVNG